MLTSPSVATRAEDARELPLLMWRFANPVVIASTASCGGGLGERRWIINAQVGRDYRRRDLDAHGAELAQVAGLTGPGVVMLTAADVRSVCSAKDAGVRAFATVGLTSPTWAAAPDEVVVEDRVPGTINIVVGVPVRLEPAALLNALCTATEAKAQALFAAGVAGTGTASDAVAIICPTSGAAERFAGPRSEWGARLARAVHDAVLEGASA
jgi:adenosylcobinamide amidohydrolase